MNNSFPPIQVFKYQEKIYSINNRRLFAFKTANTLCEGRMGQYVHNAACLDRQWN